MDFSLEFTPDLLAVFLTLFVLEVVLGVDNVIFISILAGKLPADQQKKARQVGLSLAMFMRIALLASLAWIARLTKAPGPIACCMTCALARIRRHPRTCDGSSCASEC